MLQTFPKDCPVPYFPLANLRHVEATVSTKDWKVLLRATKSVSQFTSTIVAMLLSTATPTKPCTVGLPSSFVAFDQPRACACSCSHFSAYKNHMQN